MELLSANRLITKSVKFQEQNVTTVPTIVLNTESVITQTTPPTTSHTTAEKTVPTILSSKDPKNSVVSISHSTGASAFKLPINATQDCSTFQNLKTTNVGKFNFIDDTVFHGKGNSKGTCLIEFHSYITSVQSKSKRNAWLTSARSSIRKSGITSFSKVIEKDDDNHVEFERFHQQYLDGLLFVKDSGVLNAGLGVFSKRLIKNGTFLGFYSGQQVSSDSELSAEISSYVFNTTNKDILINGHPDNGGGLLSRVNSPTTHGVVISDSVQIKSEEGDTVDNKVKRELKKVNVEAIPITIKVGIGSYCFVAYFANKKIAKGEELFLDYGEDYWTHLKYQKFCERHEAVKSGIIKSIQLGGFIEVDGELVPDLSKKPSFISQRNFETLEDVKLNIKVEFVIIEDTDDETSGSSDDEAEFDVHRAEDGVVSSSVSEISISSEDTDTEDDCVVLIPKWEVKHTEGDGNCFFHACGEPSSGIYKLNDVLNKKKLIVKSLNDLLNTINSPDVSNDAVLAYAYYEQMMVTLIGEFQLSQLPNHGMTKPYYNAIRGVVQSSGLMNYILGIYKYEDQLKQATQALKVAIKTWKGEDHFARIDEDLNRYIADLSSEEIDVTDAHRKAKEMLGVYKAAGTNYLGYFDVIMKDVAIRESVLNLTIGKPNFYIMNMQIGLSLLGLKLVTGEDLSVSLHMGGLDNTGEREALFLPKRFMEINTVGKLKFRDQLLSQYQEWADTFKPCFDVTSYDSRFHLNIIRNALQERSSGDEVIKERHIKIGGEGGNHYQAMEQILVEAETMGSGTKKSADSKSLTYVGAPTQPDTKGRVWGDLTRGVCNVPHPAKLVNNPTLSNIPLISTKVWERAILYLQPLLEAKVLSNVQADAVLAMLESNHQGNPFLLGDSPGLGKTRQALVYLCIQYQHNQEGLFFFVAPNERILESQESDLKAILEVFRANKFKVPPIQKLYQPSFKLHIKADMGICLQTTGRMPDILDKLKTKTIQALVVDEVHTVTGSLRLGKKNSDGTEEAGMLLTAMIKKTKVGQVVFVSGTPFTKTACKIMFPLLGIHSQRWHLSSNLGGLKSLMAKGQYCRREMEPMADFSFCKLGDVDYGHQVTTDPEVGAASVLSGLQETPIRKRLLLVQAEQQRLREFYAVLNAKGKKESNKHFVALFRRVKDEEKLLRLIMKLNQSDRITRHCIYSEGVDDYQGTKDGINKSAEKILIEFTEPKKSELSQLMKTTYTLQHPEQILEEFLDKKNYRLISMDEPAGFQKQWCEYENGVLVLSRKHVTGFDGLQDPFLEGTSKKNIGKIHVVSVPTDPVSLYQLKGRLERNGVAENRLHVVCYVLEKDEIGDMKDMVGMSDQMRGLSVLMDGRLSGWVKQYLGLTHLWRKRSKQKQNDHSQYINQHFRLQLNALGIKLYKNSRDFLYRLEMHPNRAAAISLFDDMERALIAREHIEEVIQTGDDIRVDYSVNDVTSSIVFRDIEIQGRSFISIDWYSPELAEFVKKTSRLFGFEGRWLKRGDGFELFDVMESTYRDALLEVYQGKGRCILELYLGATKEIQKQILGSIDKESKSKKSRLGKKRVQAQPSSDSVLTNKRSGQTPIEQGPVAKKPRLAIVSDPVPQVVSGGVPADRQLEPASDPSLDESGRENQVPGEPAAKRRRVEPERLQTNGGPMNTLQTVAQLNFVGNLAQLVLKTVEGFTDDIDASALYNALKALVPKNVAAPKPKRKGVKYPLHAAAVRAALEEVQRLIENGARIDAANINGYTALHLAAKKGYTEIVKFLLDRGANIDAVNLYGITALHWAAANGHTKTGTLLLDRGANIDAALAIDRHSALHWAAENGHTETVELLLNRGVDSNTKTSNGDTALHWAAKKGHTKTVELLLQRGADATVKDKGGNAALHLAAKKGDTETVRLLLDRGVSIDATDKEGNTALHSSTKKGDAETVTLLLERGADIKIKTAMGDKALLVSAEKGHTETVELLLNRGVDINTKKPNGNTALHCAAAKGQIGIVQLLLDRGASIDAVNLNGSPALHCAAANGHPQTVELLLKKGADNTVKDKDGKTALELALDKGHIEAITILLFEIDGTFTGGQSLENLDPSNNRNPISIDELLGNSTERNDQLGEFLESL